MAFIVIIMFNAFHYISIKHCNGFVASSRIELEYQVPETCVLSIVLRGQPIIEKTGCHLSPKAPFGTGGHCTTGPIRAKLQEKILGQAMGLIAIPFSLMSVFSPATVKK